MLKEPALSHEVVHMKLYINNSFFILFESVTYSWVRTKVDTLSAHGVNLKCTIYYYSLAVMCTSNAQNVH